MYHKEDLAPEHFTLLFRTLCFINSLFHDNKNIFCIFKSSISCCLMPDGIHTKYNIFYSESFLTFPGFIVCKAFHQNIPTFIGNSFPNLKQSFYLTAQVISIHINCVLLLSYVNSDIYGLFHKSVLIYDNLCQQGSLIIFVSLKYFGKC